VRSREHKVPCYVIFSTPPLPHPSKVCRRRGKKSKENKILQNNLLCRNRGSERYKDIANIIQYQSFINTSVEQWQNDKVMLKSMG
jgi:hypothetical protein